MRLIKDLITKKLECYNNFHLKHQYLEEVWHFYAVYSISCALIGRIGLDFKKKPNLIKRMIINFDMKTYVQISEFISKDMEVINSALEFLKEGGKSRCLKERISCLRLYEKRR